MAQSGGDLLAGCSGVLMDTDFSSSLLGEGCPADLASKGAPSPSGSEAVVPVMSLPMDEDFCAGLAVPAFKDLKDFDVSPPRALTPLPTIPQLGLIQG